MGLTPSQSAAVHYDRHLILFAGPGSGKTATSVAKGERILQSADAHLGMVTFTTSAAAEMQHRLVKTFAQKDVAIPKHRLTTGTFHSITLRHYQRHTNSTRKLLAPPARAAMINGMLSDLAYEERQEYQLALEKYQGALRPETLEFDPQIGDFIQTYLDRMKNINAIDLATVMRECTLGMGYGQIPLLPFTHLIGDEMQDADQIQLELMLVHARANITTTLVADDDQTIYGWRSALGYEGLIKFAQETGAKTIALEENFRSRSEIVEHSQVLIQHNNPQRVDKSPRAVRGPGGLVAQVGSSSIEQECMNIAAAIHRCQEPSEIFAILARSNRDLDAMEQQLASHDPPIEYHRDGTSIWSTTEVSTYLSTLQALVSGTTTDLSPILSLLPLDKTARTSLERALGAQSGPFLDGEIPTTLNVTPIDLETLERFTADTRKWRNALRAGEILRVISEVADLARSMLSGHFKTRTKLITGLIGAAESVLTAMRGTLSKRLATLTSMRQTNGATALVRLMTIHASKGQEFDTVFMLNARNPDDGSTLIDDQPERRLFFVAMTRAKNRLLVSYSGVPIKYIAEAQIPVHKSLISALSE